MPSVHTFQRLVFRRGELLVLCTGLSPGEAVARLQTYVEPPDFFIKNRFPTSYLFVGEVREHSFVLTEISAFGRRGSGTEIIGELTETATGSEITIRIRPLLVEWLIGLIVLMTGSIGLGWFTYLVLRGHYAVSCLVAPAILLGVLVTIMRSFADEPTPAYATLEDHFRRIFLVTAPTRRESDRP